MFYLCSIGSNLDPAQHVSQAVEELLARFGQLRQIGRASCRERVSSPV